MIKHIKINDYLRELLVVAPEKVKPLNRFAISDRIMADNIRQEYALKSIVEKELGSVKYD